MLEVIENLPPGITGVRAKGKVSREDYENTLHPLLEESRKHGEIIRFLYEFGPEFEEFTAGAAWSDFRIGMEFLRLFDRCAVVTDVKWLGNLVHFSSSFLTFPMKHFGLENRQEAIEWLNRPADEQGMRHELIYDKGVLVVEPKEALSVSGFEAIALTVDPWIEKNGPLNGIVLKVRRFPGWETFGGMLKHFKFVKDHHRKVRRLALVTDRKSLEKLSEIGAHFVKAEIRHFSQDEEESALDWAETGR